MNVRVFRESARPRVSPALLLISLLALAAIGCEEPPVGNMGSAITQGEVAVTVTGYEVKYVELEAPAGAEVTSEPVLVLTMEVANNSSSPVRYDLGWSSPNNTQARSPLLFVDLGEDAENGQSNHVPTLKLQGVEYLDDPVTSAVNIAPGETLTDVILFEKPEGASGLVLSLPPSIFGTEVETPAYVRIPYEEPETIEAPAPIGVGETYEGREFSFTVDSTSTEYIRLMDAEDREGYSDGPLYRINFTLTNTSETTIQYVPPGASQSANPATLVDEGNTPIPVAQFPAGITWMPDPDGAEGPRPAETREFRTQRAQIGPGESYESFLLFQQPPSDVSQLTFVVPGTRLGGTGLVRVSIPYTHQSPPEPADLTLPEPEEEDEEGEEGDE